MGVLVMGFDLRILFVKLLGRKVRGDKDVERNVEVGVFSKNFKIFFWSEAMGLVSGTSEVSDENFLSRGVFQGVFDPLREEVG